MAEFLYIYRNSGNVQNPAPTPEQRQQSMQKWMTWLRGLEAKGHLKNAGQPLEPGGKVVRKSNGVVTDGPFVEMKDVVGGYSIIEAKDLAQAAALAEGCPGLDAPGGWVEVRPAMAM